MAAPPWPFSTGTRPDCTCAQEQRSAGLRWCSSARGARSLAAAGRGMLGYAQQSLAPRCSAFPAPVPRPPAGAVHHAREAVGIWQAAEHAGQPAPAGPAGAGGGGRGALRQPVGPRCAVCCQAAMLSCWQLLLWARPPMAGRQLARPAAVAAGWLVVGPARWLPISADWHAGLQPTLIKAVLTWKRTVAQKGAADLRDTHPDMHTLPTNMWASPPTRCRLPQGLHQAQLLQAALPGGAAAGGCSSCHAARAARRRGAAGHPQVPHVQVLLQQAKPEARFLLPAAAAVCQQLSVTDQ